MIGCTHLPVHRNVFMPMTEFGMLLKRLRDEKGLTLKELGQRSGLTHVGIGDWERGKRTPRRENIEAVAAGLGVPAIPLLAAAGYLPTQSSVAADIVLRGGQTIRVEAREGQPGTVLTLDEYTMAMLDLIAHKQGNSGT